MKLNHKFFIFLMLTMSIAVFFSSCEKEEDMLVLVVYNPFDEAVVLEVDNWSAGTIESEASKRVEITDNSNVSLRARTENTDGSWTVVGQHQQQLEWGKEYVWIIGQNEIIEYDDSGNGNPADGISGNWERSDGASYLKFSGSSVYLCNGSSLQEFSGTYDASTNEATLVEGSTTLTFYIYPEDDDKILIEQYVSGNHVSSQYYYKTSLYPCD